MSRREADYWKLGLFVVAGITTAILAVFYVGARRLDRPRVRFVTYFNETVQGLDLGAPVKMRGVKIGDVRQVTIASDKRLVRVEFDIFADLLAQLDLAPADTRGDAGGPDVIDPDALSEELRLQLATTGITGVKYLDVDFFPPATFPEIALPFDPPVHYLPSAPSTLKSIEDTFLALSTHLPRVLARLDETLITLDRKLGGIDTEGVSAAVNTVLERFEAEVRAVDAGALSRELRELLATYQRVGARFDAQDGGPIERAVASLEAMTARTEELTRVTRDALVAAQLPETTSAFRETLRAYGGLAGDASLATTELRATLVQLEQTLRSAEAFLDYLERDPGALLRGRASASPLPTDR
jgi:ABC-type transporter Mla subunit MlaD